MKRLRSHEDAIAVVGGLLLPIAIAALLVPFRRMFADTASALVLVAVIVAIATIGSRMAGAVATISATLSFDFFLTRPYERFAIVQRPDIETTISLFIVGLAVTELAATNRYHRRIAVEESDYLGIIYYLSELVASGTRPGEVIEQPRLELTDLLHLRDCWYIDGPSDAQMTRLEHDGSVNVGRSRRDVHEVGLLGGVVELLVEGRGRELGHFVLDPTAGWSVSIQRRVVTAAIADQVGAALAADLGMT